jgi:hypothetical protein
MFKCIIVGLLINYHTQTTNIDLHLPKYQKKSHFYDFRYQMKDEHYFKGDMVSWSNLRFKAQFDFRTNWGNIKLDIILPPILQQGINFKL